MDLALLSYRDSVPGGEQSVSEVGILPRSPIPVWGKNSGVILHGFSLGNLFSRLASFQLGERTALYRRVREKS